MVAAPVRFSGGNDMKTITQRVLAGAALAAVLAASSAFAQQQQTIRIRGPIQAVDGSTLTVKAGEAGDLKVKLADNAAVFGVVKASLADIKPGSFIGVGATPQADGSQRAIQIMIFADVQRGTGEGHRPWDRPNTTMTNATVDQTVAGVDGQVVTVKYKDGEKKIIVGPDAVIRAYVVGSKDELKPGANIMIVRATKQPDGTFGADRVNVGRDGIEP
jgi:PKD repeat protein